MVSVFHIGRVTGVDGVPWDLDVTGAAVTSTHQHPEAPRGQPHHARAGVRAVRVQHA